MALQLSFIPHWQNWQTARMHDEIIPVDKCILLGMSSFMSDGIDSRSSSIGVIEITANSILEKKLIEHQLPFSFPPFTI